MLEARVVIADNQQENLKMIKQFLAQAGLRVVGEATDGISALKLIRNFEPEQIRELKLEVNKLKDQLESRKTIDKAKGLLMTKMGLSEDEAFKKIQKQSMEKRKTMKNIAESIIIAYEI